MVFIETFLGMARYLSPRNDDDWSDRMHYLYTPNILLAFSILVSFKQFGGRPIECMFPNKFPGSWEQYAENYCWSQDTYFVEPDKHVEQMTLEERSSHTRQLSYYQWVPFFLLLQAAFFRAPSLMWKYVSNHSGIRIHEVVEKAMDTGNVDETVREQNVVVLEKHLKKALRFQRRMEKKNVVIHRTFSCLNFQYSSSYISVVYMFTKVIYLGNCLLQLWLMNYFLKTDRYGMYGIDVLYDVITGVRWETSGYFPRTSVCDFTVRQVANIQKYSVQCVLVINIFTEKIFILLWFWYLLLLSASLFTVLYWVILLSFPCFSRWFVGQHLELSSLGGYSARTKKCRDDLYKFVHGYLHRDGVFVLRMVSSHAGVIFTTDLVLALWKEFYGIEQKMLESDPESSVDPEEQNQKNLNLRQRRGRRVKTLVDEEGLAAHLIPRHEHRLGKAGRAKDKVTPHRARIPTPELLERFDSPKSRSPVEQRYEFEENLGFRDTPDDNTVPNSSRDYDYDQYTDRY
ncbi:unnamed protein product, partial [Mesorhabditis spiculigera]